MSVLLQDGTLSERFQSLYTSMIFLTDTYESYQGACMKCKIHGETAFKFDFNVSLMLSMTRSLLSITANFFQLWTHHLSSTINKKATNVQCEQ